MNSFLIGLGILSVAMIPLETVWPGVTARRRLRRSWLLDVIHRFFTALIIKPGHLMARFNFVNESEIAALGRDRAIKALESRCAKLWS